jgi:hypothetical protein
MVLVKNGELDFDARIGPNNDFRLAWLGDALIEISKSKLANQAMRTQIVFVAHKWGYGQEDIGHKIKTRIAEAASVLISYDWGYAQQATMARTVGD